MSLQTPVDPFTYHARYWLKSGHGQEGGMRPLLARTGP
jgi:hypothetical protein